uniref:UDP-D-xylose:beta-D-glucoside alpha-1,3-D-xylosyltransferase n=1 Tax=Hirondellea gigas TaxID=1518452 RepID=A0A2P2IBU6_9CRUS
MLRSKLMFLLKLVIQRWRIILLSFAFVFTLLCVERHALFRISRERVYQNVPVTAAAADPVFIIILCEAMRRIRLHVEGDRQIQHAATLVKSAVALTSRKLRFVLILESDDIQEQFQNALKDWPDEFLNKLTFEYLPLYYPPKRDWTSDIGLECCMERLFLPHILHKYDSVIYLDSDMIFMRPPERLWDEFSKFNATHIVGMAPSLQYYVTERNKVPYYGETGLNGGLIMFNITRTKMFPGGGWLEANMKIYTQYKDLLVHADQDILNILFSKFPMHLFPVGCEWNYMAFHCRWRRNKCMETNFNGASLLHGNARIFVSMGEPTFRIMYEAWKDHNLGISLTVLYDSMRHRLYKSEINDVESRCSDSSLIAIHAVLTERFRQHLHKKSDNPR